VVVNASIDRLLKATSRSFYLSLQILPNQIKNQVGLLYLLARVADTIADTGEEPHLLLSSLEKYKKAVSNESSPIDLTNIASLQTDLSESDLLLSVNEVIEAFGRVGSADRDMMLECLLTIISGQRLDIERFGTRGSSIVSLQNDNEMDDYTYRVAGSVGEFWTRMSMSHLVFHERDPEEMLRLGIRFGKALQLINILRDIPSDLNIGRCYIPSVRLASLDMRVSDLKSEESMEKFRPLYNEYLDLACEYLDSARDYISLIPRQHRRLRISCMLPVIIGWRTIRLMRQQNVLDQDKDVKIDRKQVVSILLKTRVASRFSSYESRLMRSERDLAQ
tara:strand:- start:1347 stop:2348 length:1002 start_codon:yes stop_codon:yes gene_type:complete